ncbi:tetraspanin-32 isoform X2 [Eumetopias jubatus]|uniref:tetraspanin-32 isoform X2 n=1 Tax=Eumetopias jubatus TaxID=34886 RepID=UPI0010160AA4|nr:tetraspanin-32 isoform X2 [Eumetopias jubatus]
MAAMGPWSRVRAAKCQMLVTSFFVLLLGLSMATLAALTYFGAHFAVIGRASSDRTPYEAMHRWAFYVGISLAGLLTLGAILGAAATASLHSTGHLFSWVSLFTRRPLGGETPAPACAGLQMRPEGVLCQPSQGHMARGSGAPTKPVQEGGGDADTSALWTPRLCGRLPDELPRALGDEGFLCFALVFGALVQVAFWRFHNPTQVEDALLDAYDLLYDRAVKNLSGTPRQQLLAIQDTFLCCGKSSPFSLLGDVEAGLCRGEQAARQDCLVGIRSFLRTHRNIASTLTGIGLAAMVYAMLLSSFLWFAIRSGGSLDRKGKYTLSRRVPGYQPQEPSFFRRSQGSPKL